MPQQQWEIELSQIRQLMRNEVANHDRIRERVIHLRDLYFQGDVNEQAISWDTWAVSYFANSPENLRRILADHPNTINKFARQQQKRDEQEARHQQKMADEERKRERAEELKNAKQQTAAAKKKADKAKGLIKPKLPLLDTIQVPAHPLMVPLIERAGIAEGSRRIELGAIFSEARRLVDTHQVGKDPRTGKFWRWTVYGPDYFGFGREWISRCIKAYTENVTSQVTKSDDENVVPLRGGSSE